MTTILSRLPRALLLVLVVARSTMAVAQQQLLRPPSISELAVLARSL